MGGGRVAKYIGRPLTIGKKINRWTIIGPSDSGAYRVRKWLCQCECGSEPRMVMERRIKNGESKSCGCWRKENAPRLATIHGRSYSAEYSVWGTMIARCSNKKHAQYKHYGARGISVCHRWRYSFENFYQDMGDRPSAKHSIERIETNGNYEPDNCRWATITEQANNRRNNVIIECDGERKTISQWADVSGVSRSIIKERYCRQGWSAKDAIFLAPGSRRSDPRA